MKALGPWADREIALEQAKPEESEVVGWARAAAHEPLAKAGVAVAPEEGRPKSLVVRVREVPPDEGRATLFSSPKEFAADEAKVGVMAGARFVEQSTRNEKVKDAAAVVGMGVGGAELVKQALRVRVALELFAPERPQPLGGVVWEGYRNLDRQAEAEKAGRESGDALAEEISSQRGRWIDRRAASERLFLTPTAALLERREAVVSLDEGLLLHAGFGVNRWLQLDLAFGGMVVPTAGGILHSRRLGATAVGAFAAGLKVRLKDEGRIWPGVAASYERLSMWSGAFGSGRVALLDRIVNPADPDASSGFGLNVLTLAVSKHPKEWLQVGAGAIVVDDHSVLGSGTPVSDLDGGRSSERLPTTFVPWVNVEASAGEHFRFVGEYLAPPGADSAILGVRTVLYGTRNFGAIRTAGYKVRIDTAAMITTRDTPEGSEAAILPWIGIAFYPR